MMSASYSKLRISWAIAPSHVFKESTHGIYDAHRSHRPHGRYDVLLFPEGQEAAAGASGVRTSLAPGTEVITIGGLIGKVVEVDEQYEEIVLDSEGSLLRFSLQSVSRAYVRPAYVSDDDVDENGNPLPKDEPAQITSNEPESDGSETVVEETSVVETPEDADSSPFETQPK